ncbi:hypothetical protein N658DRAFT_494316 [Parathielavia hyrcaniae]|uniref:Uncharacterized protein n=1 Tax=Parathielavia hyrcaniae TaxID=113614 RepID=A0AAN6Q585_9PEZI|nr:hypothetical protein N658DRAFT_494316 [Parathielavia hyrcaniae]
MSNMEDTSTLTNRTIRNGREFTTRYLCVAAEHQAPGEPKNWSLFSHALPTRSPTNSAPGQVWQVTGDAELMHHDHAAGVDQLSAPDFAWHRVLRADLGEDEYARVDEVARAESPPRAANRAAVREHCQGGS